MAGSAIGALGNYFSQQAQANQQAEMAKLDAKTQKELQAQQRKYQLEARDYRKQAASKWSKYFVK